MRRIYATLTFLESMYHIDIIRAATRMRR